MKTIVYDIIAIGRSRTIIETRRVYFLTHADEEYKLMVYQFPKCKIVIEQKEVEYREVEEKIELPKTVDASKLTLAEVEDIIAKNAPKKRATKKKTSKK